MEEKDFNELVAKLEKASGEKITEQVKEYLKELDIEALKKLAEKEYASKDELKDFVKSKDMDEFKIRLEEAEEKANQALENKTSQTGNTLEDVAKEIKENKETLKSIASRTSNKEIVIKALTNRASVATNTIGLDLPGITPFGRKIRGFYDFISKQIIPLPQDHGGIIRYRDWDEATTVKAAAAIAEGAAFPESTAKFKGYTLPVEKIGDTLPVTEEFFEDEPTAAGELAQFLDANVMDKVDSSIVLGNGTSPNTKSIDSEAVAYTAPNLGLQDPNIFDLAIKVSENITANAGTKYSVDFVLMNITDVNSLVLKKDANNNYIFSRNLQEMPFTIVVDNNVAAGTMYAGDSRFVTLYEIPGVAISQGMVGTQFTEDELTIKARKRLAFLIKNGNKSGFRKVADIAAALTALGTNPA